MAETPKQPDPFDTAHLMDDLKGRSIRGGAVTVAAQGARFAIRMGSTIVLARLLTPADFGLIAMVTALTGFAMMFRDLGLSMATIQREKITHAQVSNLFWVNATVGLLVAAVVALSAPAVSWFYSDPRLTDIARALSIAFVFGGLGVQHQALLRRQMRFKALGVVAIVGMAAGVAAAIVAALLGAGYWSLVVMTLTTEAVTTLATCIAQPWRPSLPTRQSGTKSLLHFGKYITGFSLVNYFARNLDNILIGRFIGAAALGLYAKAYGLLMLPLAQINGPISSVATPALSRLKDQPERYQRYYLKTIRLIALITTPPIAFAIFFSGDIIRLVLGEQWAPAAPIFALLGLSALVQPLYNTQGWLHLTTGHSKRYFKWGVVGATVLSASFAIGVVFGARAVALAYSIGIWAILPFCMGYAGRSANIRLAAIVRSYGWPMVWAILTAGMVRLVTWPFTANWSPAATLPLALGLTALLSMPWLHVISPSLFLRIRQYLSRRPTACRST